MGTYWTSNSELVLQFEILAKAHLLNIHLPTWDVIFMLLEPQGDGTLLKVGGHWEPPLEVTHVTDSNFSICHLIHCYVETYDTLWFETLHHALCAIL